MFKFITRLFGKNDTVTTQDLIDAANSHLFTLEPKDPEYQPTLDKIKELHKLLSEEKKTGVRVTPDTVLLILGNLAGILLIMNYEKLDVMSTKAFSFIKPKV